MNERLTRGTTNRWRTHKQARDVRTDNRRGEKGGDKKPVKSDQSVINGSFRMGSHSHSVTMSGKKLKRLGDAQRKQKQSQITTTMTS